MRLAYNASVDSIREFIKSEPPMKKLVAASMLAILWAAPTQAEDPKPDTHEALVEETIKSIEKLSKILADIKDKTSSEDAKPKLEETVKAMTAMKKRADKLGEPMGAKKEELEKKYKPEMEAATKKLTGEFIRIATNVEGGQEIVKNISALFANLNPKGKDKDKK
jgi:type I site-specific restriction endonuclease